MALRETVLRLLSDPNMALAAAVAGMFLIYWELIHPGAIVPGMAGSIFFLLGLHGLTVTSRRAPDLTIALALLIPWAGLTTFLVSVAIRARRGKSVKPLSGSSCISPIETKGRFLDKGANCA